MKIFAYEHITGGGLIDSDLPAALAREGVLMADALRADLLDVPAVEVITMIDRRLATPSHAHRVRAVGNRPEWTDTLQVLLDDCDAFWPIAPESDGVLLALSARALQAGKRLLNSAPHAVRIAASKWATARALRQCGIGVVPTYRAGESIEATFGGAIDQASRAFIAKPDDGCGCAEVRRFDHVAAARAWVNAQFEPARFVLQPYVDGEAMSVCALAAGGRGWLLAVNRQHVQMVDGRFVLAGVSTHADADTDGRFAALIRAIVAAIPGLSGAFGVDVIVNDRGMFVVDVNPRLTTSFAALRRATGLNIAQLVLDVTSGGAPCLAALPAPNPVRIHLSAQLRVQAPVHA